MVVLSQTFVTCCNDHIVRFSCWLHLAYPQSHGDLLLSEGKRDIVGMMIKDVMI